MKKKALQAIIILLQVFLLYVFSLLGNWIVQRIGLPFPGSIIGLLLLLLLLHLKIIKASYVSKGAGFLLPILTLLFIPATVGIINFPQLLSPLGIILIVITIVSTLLTLGFTSVIAQKIERKDGREHVDN